MGKAYGWVLTSICGAGTVFWLVYELKLTKIREDVLKAAKVRRGSRFVTDHDDPGSGLAAFACWSCYRATHDSLNARAAPHIQAAAAAAAVAKDRAAAAAAGAVVEEGEREYSGKPNPAWLKGDSASGEDLVPGTSRTASCTAAGAKNTSGSKSVRLHAEVMTLGESVQAVQQGESVQAVHARPQGQQTAVQAGRQAAEAGDGAWGTTDGSATQEDPEQQQQQPSVTPRVTPSLD